MKSAKLTEAGPHLNVDRTATVFYKGGRLIDLIAEYLTEKRYRQRGRYDNRQRVVVDNNLQLNQDERRFLNEELKGLAFELDHIDFRPKNRIHCLTNLPMGKLRFTEKSNDGKLKQWSVKEYYDTKYASYFEKFGRQVYGNLPAVEVSVSHSNFTLDTRSLDTLSYCETFRRPRSNLV